MIDAHIVCDSVSPQETRLTTFRLRYPKFIHGEFMTHRVVSRNASSSRAIPTAKLIEEVRSDALRAAPVFWGKNQKGMQAAEELPNQPDDQVCVHERHLQPKTFHDPLIFMSERRAAQMIWRGAALIAAEQADQMVKIGAHKQIVNRLLEPFSHINVVVSATEWDNFFGLRLHRDAQPEMRALAIAMWEAMKASTPKLLQPSEWHTPFADYTDGWTGKQCQQCGGHGENPSQEFGRQACTGCGGTGEGYDDKQVIKVSVARCARVSYESFETGKRSTVEEDLKLYDRLLSAQPLHASPAEHQATPIGPGSGTYDTYLCGNFHGWKQYRKMLPGEAVAPLPEEFR